MKRRVLDLFCGLGGWSRGFASRGWECCGVDIQRLGYPFEFLHSDVRCLSEGFINSFDAVVMSPPCEDFARAHLPWLRADRQPSPEAVELLRWAVALADRPGRIVECSNFAARHVPGSVRVASWALWGDVPLLLPVPRRAKTRGSGLRPDLRALVPLELASAVESWFSAGMEVSR